MRKNQSLARSALLLFVALLSACGGGGGGGGAESTEAPYLLASPRVASVTNTADPSSYDVTVEIDADGPNGIYSGSVWLIDINDLSNSHFLDLTASVGITWTGTTNVLVPVAAGTYIVSDILLYDADPMGTSFRSGWYFEMPIYSTTHYFVDQRNVYNNPQFDQVGMGVSSVSITQFTLP